MKPIIILAVIAVAGMTLGTGFLGNQVELWIQQFGVGSGDVVKPLDHVQVDFDIQQKTDQFGHFKNLIEHCELTIVTSIGQLIGTPISNDDSTALVEKDSELTCKITNELGNVIAEGTLASNDLNPPGNGIFIPGTYLIDVLKDQNILNSWPNVDEAHDVIVVAHANTYTMGDFDATP